MIEKIDVEFSPEQSGILYLLVFVGQFYDTRIQEMILFIILRLFLSQIYGQLPQKSGNDTNKFCSQKRKMGESIFKAQPSLFFPHFDFTLMNVYMNTGIMVSG